MLRNDGEICCCGQVGMPAVFRETVKKAGRGLPRKEVSSCFFSFFFFLLASKGSYFIFGGGSPYLTGSLRTQASIAKQRNDSQNPTKARIPQPRERAPFESAELS